ncbi:MAG TPA: SpaA isopeptide-forming pilin-related protein, partial [Acidimicrobiales bacterium]|nr:SpaA isopeptide-forming pilin-related protein [Acidimicrobiales bacterium]
GLSSGCWADRVDLTTAGEADGSVNTKGTVPDPISFTDQVTGVVAHAPGTVVQNGFGETGINLTAAGIISPTTCTHFGSVELNSRSSTSFTSELKDFISPVGINITNCGDVHIVKTDDANNALGGVGFHLWTVTGSETQHSTVNDKPYDGTGGLADLSCTTTTAANATTLDPVGSCDIPKVDFGTYWVVEDSPPAGFNAAQDQKLTVSASQTSVTLTFIDTREPATLIFHKQDDAGTAMSGVSFVLKTNNAGIPGTATGISCTTLTAAQALLVGLNAGDCEMTNILPDPASGTDYWIVEGTPPTGYQGDAAYEVHLVLDQTLDLRTGSSSSVHHTFVNNRLFKIVTLVCQEGTTPSLYGSSVAYGTSGSSMVPTPPNTPNTATSISSTDPNIVAELCGLTAGADSGVTTGTYPSATNIK